MSSADEARVDLIASRVGEVEKATLVKSVASPGAYLYEVKWDGYRILAIKSGGVVRLLSRKGRDYTGELHGVARDVARLGTNEVVLDGEVCAIDERGMPSFQLLQNRASRPARTIYAVFDLLWLDGEDLRAQPLEARRAKLERVLRPARGRGGEGARMGNARDDGILVLSSMSEGDPRLMLDVVCRRGLEGIVAKRKGSTYAPGRGRDWLKLKCKQRQEFAIIGYLPLLGTQRAVGGLLLALADANRKLHYAGKVGTGFDEATRLALAKLLEVRRVSVPPAEGVPRAMTGDEGVHFSEPKYVAEVEFSEWTEGGQIRHPSFQGLREDKSPFECVREQPEEPPSLHPSDMHAHAQPAHGTAPARPAPSRRPSARGGAREEVAGISISHADRELQPTGITKLDLARYYATVGEVMLPHVAGRPLTLLRWAEKDAPEARAKGGIYLRHGRAWGPTELRRVRIHEQTKVGEYLVAESVAALVALAQMDVLEIHTWNSMADDVDRPDRLVFDLDPGPGVSFRQVVEAAHVVRVRLAAIGLASWAKTTGGKGLHVVVPIMPEAGWDACLAFARTFATEAAAAEPKRFVASMSKAVRRGRIYLDYLRNNRASTSVAAYSTRARPGAPVSVPVRWDEVGPDLRSDAWSVRDAAELVARAHDDPWPGFFEARQSLPPGAWRTSVRPRARRSRSSHEVRHVPR